MPLRPRVLHRPAGLSEAISILRENPAETAALLLGPRPPIGVFPDRANLLDLGRLELDRLAEAAGGRLSLGAALPLQALIDHPDLAALADGTLAEAARLAGHLGLRHAATLAGAVFDPDGPPEVQLVLLALNAQAVLQGAARREAPLAGVSPAPDELPLALIVARSPGWHAALVRVSRSPLDQAIVAAAAAGRVQAGAFRDVRLALSGIAPRPLVLTGADLAVDGKTWTPELGSAASAAAQAAARPVGDFRGSAEYRRAMAGVLAGRALAQLWGRAQS